MRLVLMLVAAAAALWSGYWAITARGIEHGLAGWLAERRAEGWAAEAEAIAVAGFPNRFDISVAGLMLADPGTGVAWTAPELRIEGRAYAPHRFDVIWPPAQEIATPQETVAVGAGRMAGRLAFRPGPSLALTRADFALTDFVLVSSARWRASVANAELSAVAQEGDGNRYAVTLAATDMRPPADLVRLFDRAGVMAELFESMRIEATLVFDAPWDRYAIEDRRPQPTRIELSRLDAQWGRLSLMAAGDLDVDGAGLPSGELTLRATNWREMVGIVRNSGRVPQVLADRLEDALGLVAGLSGRPDAIDVPLRFAGGRTWLGPVPLGPAPNFAIR